MLKRIFVIATLLISLPLLAQAGVAPWKVNTFAKSGGGSITSVAPGTNFTQTVLQGSVFTTYTSASATVTVTPNSGFNISRMTKNGAIVMSGSPFTLTPDYTKTQSITATFARNKLTLAATAGAGGTVTPASQAAYAGWQNPPKVFTIRPSAGKYVAGVTGLVGVEGTDYQFVNAVTGDAVLQANFYTIPGKKLKLNIINVSGNQTLAVSFSTSGADAGPNQMVAQSATVTLDGSGSIPTGGTYKWTQVQGPTVTWLTAKTIENPQFTSPNKVSTLRFKLVYNAATTKPSFVFVYVNGNMTDVAYNQCQKCHAAVGVGGTAFEDWSGTTSIHKANSVMCYDCHSGVNAGGHPGIPQCATCHTDVSDATTAQTCAGCHSPSGDIHSVTNTTAQANNDCIACHAVGIKHPGTVVDDNNGVRAITGEFSKRSHHVTGRAVTNADCAVCHLEGKNVAGAIVVDTIYHMADAKTHLRNCNTALAQTGDLSVGGDYAWDPAAPNHTLMDQFCFSCHNEAGAPQAVGIVVGNTALNPFNDSVSNDYDQVSRTNVVGVYEQFDTANSSHHAVRGAKYTKKNLTTAEFSNISTANSNFVEEGVRKSIKGVKVALNTDGTKLAGTMFETNKFVTTYTTLKGDALADNNVLHCGDCHTVGQFRAADVNVKPFNKAVIGAHGSNNEYMLRNSNGDDFFAKDALVCFICHSASTYDSDIAVTKHAGANSGWDCNGKIINSAGLTGMARLQLEEGNGTVAENVEAIEAGTYPATSGSPIFGYSCAGCHNASDAKTFGGIHGNAHNATYTTYSGAKSANTVQISTPVARQPYRFMPGLGNFRYNGGDNAAAWTVKTLSTINKQGCYTLNGLATSKSPTRARLSGTNVNTIVNPKAGENYPDDNGVLGSWGACTDHAGTSYGGGRAVTRTLLRPLTY